MEQQNESDLVKRLEQLGIEVDVSPTGTTLTYEQIYTSGPTLEEALNQFATEPDRYQGQEPAHNRKNIGDNRGIGLRVQPDKPTENKQ
ncbi:MAG TPA: hypothetical protein VFK47_13825 [Ktedonobacteraceae bacterium]|nr:hypothetical protein [Ktedonobacteraceae bacterium]